MSLVLPLLMFVLGGEPPREAHYPGASEVYRSTFDADQDQDYDGWPDGWTRRHCPGFPRYVRIQIDEQSPPSGGRCLRVDLDGGAAAAYSPSIPASPLAAYVLEGYVRTTGLQHDHASLSLTFVGQDRKNLGIFVSQAVVSTQGWQKLRLGPVLPDADATSVIVGLHVDPEADAEDLRGSVSFGGIWLGRLPQMTLAAAAVRRGKPASAQANLFAHPSTIEITCFTTGLVAPAAEIVFRLEDAGGHELSRSAQQIALTGGNLDAKGRPVGKVETVPIVRAPFDEHGRRKGDGPGPAEHVGAPDGQTASVAWRPPIFRPGFYRVSAELAAGGQPVRQVEVTLAVLEPQRVPAQSEFGWSLPRGDQPLSLGPLGTLVCQAGIRWVKYPLWCGGAVKPPIEPLVGFCDRLNAEGMAMVGMAGPPPPLPAARMFLQDPKIWYPSLETLQTRLGTQIRWWQLGNDRDTDWAGCADLAAMISPAKAALDRIGQDVPVGMGWGWQQPLPQLAPPAPQNRRGGGVSATPVSYSIPARQSGAKPAKTPWDFLSLTAEAPMTDRELADRLEGTQGAGVHRWVVLEPLPSNGHAVDDRATDLVRRMVAAKVHGAEGIFCLDPFDPQRRLVRDDGTPAELFLPWRTTALLLGGAKPLGSMALPCGSKNYVFQRRSDLVMVLWSEHSAEETMTLGAAVRQFDLWGGSRPCGVASDAAAPAAGKATAPTTSPSTFLVGHVPTFLTGLNEPLVRWQIDAALGHDGFPSIPLQPLVSSLRLKSSFTQPITGRVTLSPPPKWRIEPRIIDLRLAPGEAVQRPLEITLPLEVTAGRNVIGIDYEIQADRVYRFHTTRFLDVGTKDVLLEVTTRLEAGGELRVEQTLTNQDKRPVSFRCYLLAPGRPRQAVQVAAQPGGRDQKLYHLADGEELLGKTLWLQAEEIDGPRVLNCSVLAARGEGQRRGD